MSPKQHHKLIMEKMADVYSRINRMIYKHLLIILALATLSVAGCANLNGQHTRDTREQGQSSESFTGQWWHYYERGRSLSAGKSFSGAIADFKQAIERRGNDQWQADTEDMQVVDYFPHRELGIIYFQRKQYEEAIAELEYSLQSAPSAKAHYFLNKARAEKLYASGRDMSPPEIHLDGSSGKRAANGFTSIIKGVAVDDSFVAAIQVGDIPVPVELAAKQRVFTVEVPLQEGENVIRIIATDLVGKTTEQNLEIFCDRSGPLIEILQVDSDGENKVINGVVSDTGGLHSLTINGRPWEITGKSPAYSFKLTRPEGGVTLVATDRAGNITRASFSEDTPEDDPLLHPRHASSSLSPPVETVRSDLSAPPRSSGQPPPVDTDPPSIHLEDLGPNQETYADFVLLAGMAGDSSPLHSLLINGVPVAGKNGRKMYFSQREKLAEGDNEFSIVALDTHGNRSEKIITITRKIQNIHQPGSRLSIAILPFDLKGEVSTTGDHLYDQTIDSFVEQQRFNVLPRNTVNAVLRVVTFSSTDLADPDRVMELGRTAAAGAILTGTVIESADSIEIIGQLMDTETSTILARNDIFAEDKSFSSLATMLDTLALKFTHDFPLLAGIVIEVNNNEAVIDIGSTLQIKPNMRLLCYRKGMEITHPVTGKIMGAEPEILGELTVTEVFENFSNTRIQPLRGEVKLYDQVISR